MATNARDGRCVCLLTIHGIGFEQRPTPGVPMSGYADMLHARLSAALNGGDGPPLLSDDPQTQREGAPAGQAGPIYVESGLGLDADQAEVGPQAAGRLAESGVAHRGSREGQRQHGAARRVGALHRACRAGLFASGGPGAASGRGAGDAGQGRHLTAQLRSAVQRHSHGLRRRGGRAGATARRSGPRACGRRAAAEPARARRRTSPPPASPQVASSSAPPSPSPPRAPPLPSTASPAPSDHSSDILLQLQDDVATYVCHDDLRQRVRGFVREALLRLIYRKDVAGVIINAHSHGTVVAFDVLSQLSPFEAKKIWGMVTMGSPLRKYIDLFNWEREIGALRALNQHGAVGTNAAGENVLALDWTNYWDPRDPVADPLRATLARGAAARDAHRRGNAAPVGRPRQRRTLPHRRGRPPGGQCHS